MRCAWCGMETADTQVCVWCKRNPRGALEKQPTPQSEETVSDAPPAAIEPASATPTTEPTTHPQPPCSWSEMTPEQKRDAAQGCLVLIGIVVILGLILGWWNRDDIARSEAVWYARREVKKLLLAPDTARFSDEVVRPLYGENRWEVVGFVTAKNAFGVPIKRRYFVQLRITGAGAYVVEDIGFPD